MLRSGSKNVLIYVHGRLISIGTRPKPARSRTISLETLLSFKIVKSDSKTCQHEPQDSTLFFGEDCEAYGQHRKEQIVAATELHPLQQRNNSNKIKETERHIGITRCRIASAVLYKNRHNGKHCRKKQSVAMRGKSPLRCIKKSQQSCKKEREGDFYKNIVCFTEGHKNKAFKQGYHDGVVGVIHHPVVLNKIIGKDGRGMKNYFRPYAPLHHIIRQMHRQKKRSKKNNCHSRCNTHNTEGAYTPV